MTVKGLEGSCDLPRDRTCIIGIHRPDADPAFDRLLLHPRDYGFAAAEVPLESDEQLVADLQAVLQGTPGELMESTVWSGGFYLWQSGVCADLAAGLAQARELLTNGAAARQLNQLQQAIAATQVDTQSARAFASST